MPAYIPYGFARGRRYPSVESPSERAYFDAVLQAERYLSSLQVTDAEGTRWQTNGGTQKVEFYEGSSGIAYFYLRLYQATGDDRYADIVKDAARYLEAHWRDAIGSTIFRKGPSRPDLDLRYGLYRGIGGPAWFLLEAYKEFNEPSYAGAIQDIIRYYADSASHDDRGAYWYDRSSVYLDGGIILLLIAYDAVFHDEAVNRLITDAGKRYLTLGEDDGHGGLFFDGYKGYSDATWQNMEFGSPGAALVLTRLHEYTGDDAYARVAAAALIHARQVELPVGDGALIPFNISYDGKPLTGDDGKPIFYLGWCNGVVGTSLSYYAVYADTHDIQYLQAIERFADAFESLGAPEHESSGLWNSVCYCCGHASILQHFISLYIVTGNPRWERLAERTASVLLGTKEPLDDGAADWPIAWERIHPDQLTRSPGYFDGAAGIASALLQFHLLKTKGREGFHWNRLIDDPYPEQAA